MSDEGTVISDDGVISSPATSTSSIPAGWYADPAGSPGKRWWNGATWTKDIVDSPPTETSSTQPVIEIESDQPFKPLQPLQPLAGTNYSGQRGTSPSTYSTLTGSRPLIKQVKPGIEYTRSVWWISAYPLWSIVPIIFIITLFGVTDTIAISIGVSISGLVSWIILIALAFSDRAALLDGGNQTVGSPWWMLLSPLFYLIFRTLQVKRWAESGWGPLIWWIVASIISPVVAIVVMFGVLGLNPLA